jgi:hypothetical protein
VDLLWLKISYKENDKGEPPIKERKVLVAIDSKKSVPETSRQETFRVSPIFPLVLGRKKPECKNTSIYFFNFRNAFRVLGRIQASGSPQLKSSVYFSLGLSSIILITPDKNIFQEFNKIVKPYREEASEQWIINKSILVRRSYKLNKNGKVNSPVNTEIINYDSLSASDRAVMDEFKVSISLLLLKLNSHMPSEIPKFTRLIEEANSMIGQLVYFTKLKGKPPRSLSEYSLRELKADKSIIERIRHQHLDRIIQMNSALSYVSTQAFSGAIPILERRSLIRRNSLLGVGSAILALNEITRFIETSFSKVQIEEVINLDMEKASALPGLEKLPEYDSHNWSDGSINNFRGKGSKDYSYLKLPYFSGRLGYRETEYSIAAAMQSLSSGASLEWSLMTLTHELLHGHVRKITAALFFAGEKFKSHEKEEYFFKNFIKQWERKLKKGTLIDSIRNIIYTYCSFTVTHGSLNAKPRATSPTQYNVVTPKNAKELRALLEKENRNISEIFVHVLDLHYFYASRVFEYIPLIWGSWAAVPHINGDLRQYILRSLLAISSKKKGSSEIRFNYAVSTLRELLDKHSTGQLDYAVIREVIKILDNMKIEEVYFEYFPSFHASLIIVDLVSKVFISQKIRSSLIDDPLVKWNGDELEEDRIEKKFYYEMPEGFNDESIKSPISFLLDRMIKRLDKMDEIIDLERETTTQFLALSSSE